MQVRCCCPQEESAATAADTPCPSPNFGCNPIGCCCVCKERGMGSRGVGRVLARQPRFLRAERMYQRVQFGDPQLSRLDTCCLTHYVFIGVETNARKDHRKKWMRRFARRVCERFENHKNHFKLACLVYRSYVTQGNTSPFALWADCQSSAAPHHV